MQISEKDFLNYIKCPLYYKLEANGQDLEKDTYNSYLHYTANQYLNRLANVQLLGEFNQEKYIKKIYLYTIGIYFQKCYNKTVKEKQQYLLIGEFYAS